MLMYQLQRDGLHCADFYLRGGEFARRHFTFDLSSQSIVEVCRQIECQLVCSGLISSEEFTYWLGLFALYLSRHGLYIDTLTIC